MSSVLAELLDRSEGSREIGRNMGIRGDRLGQAGVLAAQRRLESRKARRFTAEVQQAIESNVEISYYNEITLKARSLT